MVSIFKIIRHNDIHLLKFLIDASTGDQHRTTYSNVTKKDIQWIQHYLKRSGSKYFDLNKRSSVGRTPLHCAATWNRVAIAHALIELPQVDVNLRDRENGWTALHRSLYMGNIEIAVMLLKRKDLDLSIKDWDGFSAFELYDSTIVDTYAKERILIKENLRGQESTFADDDQYLNLSNHQMLGNNERKGGTDLYTWGHNTNYVLGHSDSENRTNPERVRLELESQKSTYIMKRPTYLIESVTMSKYHMAILTSDASLNLLVCGFGRGGRLGLGKESETQFTPVPVQWPERISAVALGRDHTVAVTENGNVISFGSNRFGQLGYETENRNKEGPVQLVPRKIQSQSLKKQPIIGAAASRIHSVVYTHHDIFTFGYNQGQLGYYQPDNDPCQTTPRKVSMSIEILQVVANDNATAILNKSYEIILLCNYKQQRLFIPISRFPSNIKVYLPEPSYPTKLIGSGTEHLGAVSNTGDVFIWTCRSRQTRQMEQTTALRNKQQTPPVVISTPKRIWTLNKAHLAAVDASIGQHGEIIVCTVSGHVFVGCSETNGYKFNQMPRLQRCIRVCANSSGAFAAIRSEYMLPSSEKIPPSTLEADLFHSLPYTSITHQLTDELNEIRFMMDSEVSNQKTRRNEKATNDTENDESSEYEAKQEAAMRYKYNNLMLGAVETAWRRIDAISEKDKTLDIIFVVEGRNVYCHSSILRCRSKIFTQLIKCLDRSMGERLKIRLNKRASDKRIEICIEHCQLASLLLLLDYIYTDKYQHPMKAFFRMPPLCFSDLNTFTSPSSVLIKDIQKDLVTLSKLFHLPRLTSSAQSSFSHTPVPSLMDDLKSLLEKEKGADVIVQAKDHTELRCHEIILRQRCPFFGNIFKPGSVWLSDRKEQLQKDDLVKINLDHISLEVLTTLIRYIYLDQDGSTLFNDIEKDREESMMEFLLEFLCEADALLLNRLKAITENVLERFIKLRSASNILEYADVYLADSLKKACLQFISVNLSVFLESSMLDFTPTSLVRDLEDYVRECQLQAMPNVPRQLPDFYDYNTEEDTEFSSSLFALSRGDGSVTTFDEVLMTYYPEKNSEEKPTSSKQLGSTIEDPPKGMLPNTPQKAADNIGKMKRGTRVSLDRLESELNGMSNDQLRRRSSAGWDAEVIAESSSKPSLREIIETENQPTDLMPKSQKPNTLKKISQKERRRLAQQQEQEAGTELPVTGPKPVWGKVPAVQAKPITKIMAEIVTDPVRESSSTSSGSSDKKGKKIYVPEEVLDEIEGSGSSSSRQTTPNMDKVLYDPVESLGPSFLITPIRRLKLDRNSSSDSDAKKSFQTIQRQQELEDQWLKSGRPKKNILRIQKEEQAMTGIAEYYVKTLDIMSGEWCEIKRMPTR